MLSTINSINKMYAQIPNLLKTTSLFKINIRQLIEAAGISRSSFYANFSDMPKFIDKYEYDLIKNVQVSPNVMIKSIQATKETPDIKFAYSIYSDLTGNIAKYFSHFQSLMGNNGDPFFINKLRAGLIDTLFQAVDDNSFNDTYFENIPADYAMPIYFSNVIVILEHWLTKTNPEKSDTVAEIITESRYTAPYNLFLKNN